MHGAAPGDSRAPSQGPSVLRIVGFVVALVLGGAGVWMIVTASTKQWTELGILAGLWGLLIGAFTAFGPRHQAAPVVPEAPARASGAELERAAAAAERLEHEARLVLLLRHEVQTTVTRELASLRTEVAQLRSELIEKVGGQLRLERIETTRVIGSDIEALQREVDILKATRPLTPIAPPSFSLPSVVDAVVDAGSDDDSGRRRRRDDDEGGTDLLSQILAREATSGGGRHSR